MWPRRPPFHALLAVCKTRCISPCFSSQDPTFSLKSQISRNVKLLKSSKPKNRENIQFGNLKLGQNQFTSIFCSRYSVPKGPRFSSGQFTYKPLCYALWAAQQFYPNQSWVPPLGLVGYKNLGAGIYKFLKMHIEAYKNLYWRRYMYLQISQNAHRSFWYKSGKRQLLGVDLRKKGVIGCKIGVKKEAVTGTQYPSTYGSAPLHVLYHDYFWSDLTQWLTIMYLSQPI